MLFVKWVMSVKVSKESLTDNTFIYADYAMKVVLLEVALTMYFVHVLILKGLKRL